MIILYKIANPWVFPVLVIYAAIGTYFAGKLAKPLKELDYQQEGREGSLYAKLMVWTKSPSTAPPALDEVKQNWVILANRNKLLGFFQSAYGQVGVIIPYLIMAPFYFTSTMTVGILFQVADSARNILDALMVIIDRRDVIAQLDATTKRIEELK